MADTYADTDELLSDKLPDVTSEDEIATIGRMNEAVSALVDNYCRRKSGYFLPAGDAATMKRYRGRGGKILFIGRHVPASVTVAGINSSQYYESEKTGDLYMTADFVECGSIWTPGRLFEVSAKWGYEETPAPIVEAVKQIVEYWYNKGEGVIGEVSPSNFVIERNAPLSAKMLLESYIKNEFEVE